MRDELQLGNKVDWFGILPGQPNLTGAEACQMGPILRHYIDRMDTDDPIDREDSMR